jgi:hypothetical protein
VHFGATSAIELEVIGRVLGDVLPPLRLVQCGTNYSMVVHQGGGGHPASRQSVIPAVQVTRRELCNLNPAEGAGFDVCRLASVSVQGVGRSTSGLTMRDPLVEQHRKGHGLGWVHCDPELAFGDIGNQPGELPLGFCDAYALLLARVRVGLRHLLANSSVVR